MIKKTYILILFSSSLFFTSYSMMHEDQKLLSFMHALYQKALTCVHDETKQLVMYKHYKEHTYEFCDSLSAVHTMINHVYNLLDDAWIPFLQTRFTPIAQHKLLQFFLFARNKDLIPSLDELITMQKELQNQHDTRMQEGEFVPQELIQAIKNIEQICVFCQKQAQLMQKTPEEIFILSLDRIKENRHALIQAFKDEDINAIENSMQQPIHLSEIPLLDLTPKKEEVMVVSVKTEEKIESVPLDRKARQQLRRKQRIQRKQQAEKA